MTALRRTFGAPVPSRAQGRHGATPAARLLASGAGWPDEDVWRGLQAEAREEERDWAQWEAEREEPATEDGTFDG